MVNKEIFWAGIIIGGILGIFIALGLAIVEVYQAKSFCSSVNGDYSFNFKEVKHYCNNSEINRYSDGWDFDFNRDVSNIIVKLP